MILKRNRRNVAPLNTTSTADLSFILLVFFLVITSMDRDKGLMRQLPPDDSKEQTAVVDVKRSNIMDIGIDDRGGITVDGQPARLETLKGSIARFIVTQAEREKHVIALHVDGGAEYDAYFHVQHEITAAYLLLRNEYTTKRFGRKYSKCSTAQRKEAMAYYPQRISECIGQPRGKGVQP